MRRIAWVIVATAVGLMLADTWVHRSAHFHPHFPIESQWGFYGLIGILSPLVLVLVARAVWPMIRQRNGEMNPHA